MNDFNLLRPVIFANLKVGEVLQAYSGLPPTVAYKAPTFAVLKLEDGSEGYYEIYKLETSYKLVPLCWVEGKPVYPGDKLYRPEVEGVVALVASHITRSESGVEYLHFSNASGANEYADNRRGYLTWIKTESKPKPSFQVEGQDVFPGDTVYYYGDDKYMWGREMIVEKDSCVNGVHAESFAKGAATFRLKPMFVIGDHLVPMPVREPLEEGETYFTPSLYNPEAVGLNTWRDTTHDRACLKAGLIHHTTKAAVAHGEALRALLSKRRADS